MIDHTVTNVYRRDQSNTTQRIEATSAYAFVITVFVSFVFELQAELRLSVHRSSKIHFVGRNINETK